MARAGRVAPRSIAAALALVGAGVLLGGCQQPVSESEARTACEYVHSSINLFTRAQHESSAAASKDRATSLLQLRLALPQAALASTKNGGWDALVTTLSETSRVPEADLISALTQQCAVFYVAGSPTSP